MGILDWYDTNHDGHYSGAEIDRWQLDNAEYPGMFEHEHDDYGTDRDWDDDLYPASSRKDREDHEQGDHCDPSDWIDSGIDYEVIDYDKGIVRNENRCWQCLFWRDDFDEWTRDYGCRIYYTHVLKKAPYMDGGSIHGEYDDGETCNKFTPRPDRTVDCLDCAHLDLPPWVDRDWRYLHIVDMYCDIIDKTEDYLSEGEGRNPDGTKYTTLICPRFKMRKDED